MARATVSKSEPLQQGCWRLVQGEGEVHAESPGDLWRRVTDHVAGRTGQGLVVLAPFGSGKTHLCERLANEVFADSPPCTVVPLRVIARARSLESGLAAVVGPQRLFEAQEGRRILLLDGLDEVQDPGPGGFPGFVDELLALTGPRWILTSRPSHFRTEWRGSPEQVDSLGWSGVETIVIAPLSAETVMGVLGALPGGAALIDSVEGLAQLASSPILLHAVHAALPYIEPNRPIQPWGVFDAWLRYDLDSGPGHTEALEALVEMAWRVFEDNGRSVEVTSFDPDRARRAQLPSAFRRALLVTDLDGQLRFGHRSVFEFLLACRIAPQLVANQGQGPDHLSGLRISDATRAFTVGRAPMKVKVEGARSLVPQGNFIAGGDVSLDERPLRIAHLAKPVWIARAPVTNGDWDRYLGEHPDPRVDAWYLRHWGPDRICPPGQQDAPVYHLWPEDADLYASRRGGRLPTADEWEKAVRGPDGRRWVWGDWFDAGLAVTSETGLNRPLGVRAFGAQGFCGLYGSCGGVFETTATTYQEQENRGRVLMGGCFTHPASTSRASLRLSHKLSGNLKAGLRLAWDGI